MPLYECSNCGTVDNTALTNFWQRRIENQPQLCSKCDPEIGHWHGKFPQMTRTEHDAQSKRKVEYPVGD